MHRSTDVPAWQLEGFDEVFDRLVSSMTPEEKAAQAPMVEHLTKLAEANRSSPFRSENILAREFTPEQRVAGLTPEQRLAGLSSEQQILALNDDVLRGFRDDYLSSLPAHVRDAIRERIGRPAP